eukprot:scaffold2868_cov348-Pavlova_lutheri.AAC.11
MTPAPPCGSPRPPSHPPSPPASALATVPDGLPDPPPQPVRVLPAWQAWRGWTVLPGFTPLDPALSMGVAGKGLPNRVLGPSQPRKTALDSLLGQRPPPRRSRSFRKDLD